MPVQFAAAAGSKQEKANDNVLIFIGSARRHLRLSDSINAALRDAARKVAFYHSVSAETASHESSGALVGNTFVYAFELKDPSDYASYIDKLEYNDKTDVFEYDNAVFVRVGYRSDARINIDYKPVQNDNKPWWIDTIPLKIGSYLAAVGFSAPRLYHNDTVIASYENAIISMMESSCVRSRTIESETDRSINSSSLLITAGTLTGFFVLDTWTDPVTKSVWTLAIAKDFTENEIASDNSSYNSVFVPSPSYQIVPAQAFPDTSVPANWTTNLPRDTETTVYFWGFSGKSKDRREAETKALQDAKIRISGYIYETVEGNYTEISRYKSDMGHIAEDSEIINEFSRSYTKNILEGVKPTRSQPVNHTDGNVEVQILVSIAKVDINNKRNEIDRQMASLSRYYSSQITAQDAPSLETLRKYERIAAQLDPLQRSLVNYLGLAEPVNLYVYLNEQIRKLSNIVYTAHIEFRGNFSDFEKNNILNALQDGLRSNNVFLHLHNIEAAAGFKFIVSGEEDVNYSLVRWKIPGLSMQFIHGNTLLITDNLQITVQIDREWLINATVKEIRQRNDFFKKIKDTLERK
jgi:hypothetical protein